MITPLISILSVLFVFFASHPVVAQTGFINAEHKKAVVLAREGESGQAIALFRRLLFKTPNHQKLLSDYLLALSWNEQCAEVITIHEGRLKAPPPYVLNAVAKCYRNLKKFDRAILIYEASLLKRPRDRETKLGLAHAYADAGRGKEALRLIEELMALDQADMKPRFAKAYLHERQREHFKALREYEAILKKDPENQEAWRLKINLLSTLGAHQIALETALKRNDPADRSLETHLKLNRAAQALRWGKTLTGLTREERMKETDLALNILSEVLQDDPKNIRARGDRMTGLFQRARIQEGIAIYEALEKENIPLVDAVKMAAAEAYLTLKRPEEAVAIYQEILKRRPHDFQARLHLVHAVILQHKFVEAEGMIRVLKRQEASPTIRKQGILEPNWRKVEVEAAEIWLSAYRDQLAQAEKRFKLLLDQAPMNSSLHSGLAHLYLWRGWPRKALREFEQILHYDPRYVGVRVGYATTLMGMNRHEEAKTELARLVEQAPFSPHVQQLQKELRVHDQNELWGYSNFRREERGSRAWYAETSLNSRPVFSRYRITADLIRQDSRADNDQFTYTRFNAGLSYAGDQGLTLRQKITFDLESTGHTGAITDALYQINDYWRVDARYDSFSLNVPVRASVAGITAKALDLGVLYRPHERTETRLSLSQIRLSDGNRRNRYSLQTQYKLVPGAIYTHFLQFYLSRSRNSLDGRVYFNPRNDLSYALTTRHQWRRNDTRPGREFRHALSGTLGVYDQAGFSSGLTGELRYAHEWDFAVGETLAYHLAYNRRIFDGASEYAPAFNIRFIHHF